MKFLIYGATKGKGEGLGRSVALSLLKRRHEVRGLCRNSDKAALEKDFPLEAVDLCAEGGRERLKQLIRDEDPDVIWSACGTGYGEPLWSLPEHAIEDMIDANVRNNILFCRTCAPSCLDGGPHLILTGSIAGVVAGTGASVYAGVKGFLVPFVRGAVLELSRNGQHPKISLIVLPAMRGISLNVLVEALEYVGAQPRSVELHIH
jgi:short-subunit dehydrogenase